MLLSLRVLKNACIYQKGRVKNDRYETTFKLVESFFLVLFINSYFINSLDEHF